MRGEHIEEHPEEDEDISPERKEEAKEESIEQPIVQPASPVEEPIFEKPKEEDAAPVISADNKEEEKVLAEEEVGEKEGKEEIPDQEDKGFVTDRSELPADCGEADIAQRKSYKVDLKKGETYYYCTCGKSKNQPFCDGSHEGTKFRPLQFVFEGDAENPDEIEKKSLCGCKHNKVESGAFCDGSHKNVPEW